MENQVTKAFLSEAISLHQSNSYEQSAKCYIKVLNEKPFCPKANYNYSLLLYENHKIDEAIKHCTNAVNAAPTIELSWQLLCSLHQVAENRKQLNSVLKKIRKLNLFDPPSNSKLSHQIKELILPVCEDPDEADLKSLLVLFNLQKFEEVALECQNLLKNFPQSPLLHNIAGVLGVKLTKVEEAIRSYKYAIALRPEFPDPYNNLGKLLIDTDNIDRAISYLKYAVSLKPNYFQAYYNMGNGYKKVKEYRLAIKNYHTALKLNKHSYESLCNLASCYFESGKLESSVATYITAISNKPENDIAYHGLSTVLRNKVFNEANPELIEIIKHILLSNRYSRPVDIAKATISLLKFETPFSEILGNPHFLNQKDELEKICELGDGHILYLLLKLCPLVDIDFERILIKLRSYLLDAILSKTFKNSYKDILSALAVQSYINEYIWEQSENERKKVKKLDAEIASAIENGVTVDLEKLLALWCYQCPKKTNWNASLSSTKEEVLEIFEYVSFEKIREENSIVNFSDITDPTSQVVRAQYEESPYPRWTSIRKYKKSVTLKQFFNDLKIKHSRTAVLDTLSPKILIAGCGTGQHALTTALKFSNCNVDAIDLSRSSLAYGQWKAETLNIQNINFIQADLLNIPKLGKKYDVIECSGVLHHMANPQQGWNTLVDCIQPQGMMKIGLYSRAARAHIIKTRSELSIDYTNCTLEIVRGIRKELIKSTADHHRALIKSHDFYSYSSLRDLIFHVKEHQFDLLEIQNMITDLNLKFCGFEDKEVVGLFTRLHSESELYNLRAWAEFEAHNPNVFGGMYQFWCQKLG